MENNTSLGDKRLLPEHPPNFKLYLIHIPTPRILGLYHLLLLGLYIDQLITSNDTKLDN